VRFPSIVLLLAGNSRQIAVRADGSHDGSGDRDYFSPELGLSLHVRELVAVQLLLNSDERRYLTFAAHESAKVSVMNGTVSGTRVAPGSED
jgi:hypothetical protein